MMLQDRFIVKMSCGWLCSKTQQMLRFTTLKGLDD